MYNKNMMTALMGSAALLVPSVSFAQDIADDADGDQAQIQDIVVTAQKRSENLNDVGVTITALGGDLLARSGVDSAGDLALVVPGFAYADSGLNTPIYTLRGVGFNETSLAASSTVSVYVDEVGLPFPSTTRGAVLDLERVEVVKGPQGTLYGQNTTAGAINYISNKPTDDPRAGLQVGFARFNALSLEGYVSGPLTSGIRARVAARADTADGWQRSLTRRDANGRISKLSGRVIVEGDVSERLKLTFTASGWTDKGDTPAPQLLGIDLENPANPNPALLNAPLVQIGQSRLADWNADYSLRKDDRFFQLSGRVDLEIADAIDLVSISSYSDYQTSAGNEYDGTAAEIFSFRTGGNIESFAQELRLGGTFLRDSTWIIGANYSNSETRDTNSLRTGGTSANFTGNGMGTGVLSAENFADQKIRTIAAFASADWQISESFKITTGARYTDFRARFAGCAGDTGDNTLSSIIQFVSNLIRDGQGQPRLPNSAFIPGVFANGVCTTFVSPGNDPSLIATPGVIRSTLKEDNISWRIAANWQPTRDLLLYSSVSQGYKAGSYPTVASTSFAQYEPATQEKLIAYEAGAKATLFDRSVQLNAAAFYYDYTDKQQRGFFNDPTFATLSRLTNIPKSKVYGAEFDMLWLPIEGLTLSASGVYIKTEIDRFSGLNSKGVQTDFAGGVLSFAPKWQFNADAEYRTTINAAALEAFFGANYAYRSSASASFGEDPRTQLPSYNIVGLRAGIADRDAGWQLTVFGENVTNEYYLNNVVPLFDTIKGYAALPVSYGVRFKYDF